jgi:hypothetical protein
MLGRAGPDLPFARAGRTRGTAFEGWYWRFVAGDRVVVALCGCMRGGWALTALAVHPEQIVREAIVEPAAGWPGRFGVTAAGALAGDDRGLRVRIGDATLDVRLRSGVLWPRRPFGALGPASLVPFLPQYWQPVVLDAEADGHLRIGDDRVELDGARVYVEKNWGPAFAGDWWWGQAHTASGALVAFAGGRVGPLSPTAVVVRLPSGSLLNAPLARARAEDGEWRVRARTAAHRIAVDADGSGPHVRPVPVPGERRAVPRSHQVLAGRLRLRVWRGRRLLLDETSASAGLERGFTRARPAAPPG